MVLEILSKPRSFFDEQVENPGLLIPTLIVLLAALIAAAGTALQVNVSGQVVTNAVQSQGQQMNQSTADAIGTFTSIFGVIFGFLGVLFAWVVYSVVFYAIARFVFGGDGSLGNTFAFTGWGYIPLLVSQVISAIAAYYVYAGVTLPDNNQAANAALQELQNDPALFVTSLIGIVLLAWSGWIWTAGMEKLHGLSRRNAIITVGIPVVIALVLRILSVI
ncbi:Yip1 family protein [Haladaptatus sp. CMAA 1911]|uniref:Yip1 family protein n=1 Tax=unclassified Haladaptatus TaxID=2622732 RepID=UPI003754C226